MGSSLLIFQVFLIFNLYSSHFAIEWNGNWAFACDFHEGNMGNQNSRGEDCGPICEKTPGCTHFTWTTYNQGTCWLKSGAVSKNDAFDTGDRSMVCGVAVTTNSDFPGCQFKSGRGYDDKISESEFDNVDHISIWINTISDEYGTDFNPWFQGKMIDLCKSKNKVPVFYAYVIPFEARHKKNYQDCDVKIDNSLCKFGSSFIRSNRELLVQRYRHHASSIADRLGRDRTAVFLIEPDFWQYYGDNRQQDGTLSGDYMRDLFNDFVRVIKENLPKALIAWDISAWIGEDGFRKYWNNFKDSQIDFLFTSGGQGHGELSNIKPNELTWSFVSQTTGKKIIADCGYGVGGGPSDNCWAWRDSGNLNNRKNDGVVALTQANGYQALPFKPNLC